MDVERQVSRITPKSSLDELCEALIAAEWLLARARTIDRLLKEAAIKWVDHNGEFDIGDMHYYVSCPLTMKCRNLTQTGHAVLSAAGGDFDQFLGVLVSQPYKYAAVRNIVGKALQGQLFLAQRTGRLVNGVPERVLKHADKRFVLDVSAAERRLPIT